MNSSARNGSGNMAQGPPTSEGELVAWCFAYVVICITTIFGNSLTIAVFTRKHFQRKKLHYLLINLAVTDLIVGAISVPMQIAAFVAEHKGPLARSVHGAHFFLDVLSGLTSMYSIAFISVERLVAVCWPLKHRNLKLWHYALAISSTWLIAGTVALVSHQVLPRRISHMEGLNVRTVFAVIPIVVTIASYCFLWFIRKRNEDKTRDHKYNKAIVCTLLIVTMVFFCTWSPFIMLASIVEYVGFGHLRQCCSLTLDGLILALYFTKMLQYCNSCVNPSIYAFRIQSFRAAAWNILCGSNIARPSFIGSLRESKMNTSSTYAPDVQMRNIAVISANGNNETGKPERTADDQKL